MRGEVCVGFASFLAFAATILLIFAHVGQINTSTVPRGIYMTKVNVSQYGSALGLALLDPIDGLYTSNSSAPLGSGAGLRQYYTFGFYSYCAYTSPNSSVPDGPPLGICSNQSAGFQYTPFDRLTSDMLANYTDLTEAIITQQLTTFRDSKYLGNSSKAAYAMILLGTISAALAFFSGVAKHSITFFLSAILAGISSVFLLIGAAIWTVLIKRSGTVSGLVVGTNNAPLGIEVSTGPALYMVWASFACMFASMVPYLVSCCTYRG